jgi:hypothetical protein
LALSFTLVRCPSDPVGSSDPAVVSETSRNHDLETVSYDLPSEPASGAESGRVLSEVQIESALTDVRAEICLLEAERLRLTKELAALADTSDDTPHRDERTELSNRQEVIERRLERLEAFSAGLRAQLEQAHRSRTGGGLPPSG